MTYDTREDYADAPEQSGALAKSQMHAALMTEHDPFAMARAIETMNDAQLIDYDASARELETGTWVARLLFHHEAAKRATARAKAQKTSVFEAMKQTAREFNIGWRTLYIEAQIAHEFFNEEKIPPARTEIKTAVQALGEKNFLAKAIRAPRGMRLHALFIMAEKKLADPAYSTRDAERDVAELRAQAGMATQQAAAESDPFGDPEKNSYAASDGEEESEGFEAPPEKPETPESVFELCLAIMDASREAAETKSDVFVYQSAQGPTFSPLIPGPGTNVIMLRADGTYVFGHCEDEPDPPRAMTASRIPAVGMGTPPSGPSLINLFGRIKGGQAL